LGVGHAPREALMEDWQIVVVAGTYGVGALLIALLAAQIWTMWRNRK
jgi:hypothetical protein